MATPKNTTGMIAGAAAAKAAAPIRKTPAQMMNSILSSEATQKMLATMCKENAGAITASILDLYNTDTYLQQCDPRQVFGECIKAVSLNLPINKQLGFAWIVPYRDNSRGGIMIPTFQIGYKGLVQLAMRTGAYKYINAGPVYEGEFQGRNKLTGAIDLDGERTGDTVVGYFAYIETLNGFSKTLYWTADEAKAHAAKYSQSYKQGASIWKKNYDEMQTKSVLRNLLSHWGVMSVDMQTAIAKDEAADEIDCIEVDAAEADTPAPAMKVDEETGEILEG